MDTRYELKINPDRSTGLYRIHLVKKYDSGYQQEELVEYADNLDAGLRRCDELNKTLG
jgi:hypothetical protein